MEGTMTGIERINVTLTGKTPLVLNNIDMADPEYKYSKLRQQILDKRPKDRTDTDQAMLERLDWEGSLYLDEDDRIIFPTYNISRSLQRGGSAFRLGTKIAAGINFEEQAVPLKYDGPKSLDKLYEVDGFRWRKMVNKTPTAAKASMVVCIRPKFDTWSLTFTAQVQTDVIDMDDALKVLTTAGAGQGIGNARRLGFGQFEYELNWQKSL